MAACLTWVSAISLPGTPRRPGTVASYAARQGCRALSQIGAHPYPQGSNLPLGQDVNHSTGRISRQDPTRVSLNGNLIRQCSHPCVVRVLVPKVSDFYINPQVA